MNRFTGYSRMWFLAFLLVAVTAGCGHKNDGGGGGNPDITAPTVNSSTPAHGATGVALNGKIAVAFSEPLDSATVSAATFTVKQGSTAVPGAVTYSGVTAIFAPTNNLTASTIYTVAVTTGAKDLAGNQLASGYSSTFTTGTAADNAAPTVTGTINANGATNVPMNTKVGATFSEGMDPLTITNVNFTVKETVSGAAVAGAVSYSGVNAVFTPAGNLTGSTNYTVTIKGGAGGVKDLAGNALAADFVISWTTSALADTSAPTILGTINANNATNVPVNTKVGATFSEGMDPLTVTNVNFTLKETVSGAAVAGTVSYSGVNAVFTPAGNLTGSMNYTATIKGGAGGVKDLAGNALAATYVWSWTTAAAADSTAPTVNSTVPVNLATGVVINSKINATFSEAMDPLTVTTANFTVKEAISGNNVPGTVSYAGTAAAFAPLSNLASGATYTATITTGVTDLAGNAMAAGKVWSFTTGTAPAAGPAPVLLGTAGNFVILTTTGVTNVPASAITGNIGASPITAASMDNVFCSEMTGLIYGVDAAYTGNGNVTCFKPGTTGGTRTPTRLSWTTRYLIWQSHTPMPQDGQLIIPNWARERSAV